MGENELKVVGFPKLDTDSITRLEGQDFSHEFEVSLRPEIDLTDYKGISVESQLAPVMEQEVEAALEDVRKQQAHPEPAGEEGLGEDGMALTKVEWTVDDESVLEREGLRLSPEMPIPGVDAEAYTAAMSGKGDGDEVELELTVPDDFEKEEMRGKKGLCKIRIDQAYKMIPPTDDELLKMLAVEEGEDLEKAISKRIGEAKQEQEERRIENEILERLVREHPMELPEKMIEEQTGMRLAQLKQQLSEQGTPEDKLDEEAAQHEAEMRQTSEKGMRTLFLIQAIAEKEDLLVKNEDMLEELKSIAERNQSTFEEVRDYYQENRLFDQMAIEILERKVRGFLRENAEVVEPT